MKKITKELMLALMLMIGFYLMFGVFGIGLFIVIASLSILIFFYFKEK
ncbi:MAG: hypothetical protein H8D23_20960 [Candidatus Brocadiales bacterium]|nr:hypothetical protein [Candidatus Brocadiales bacterium]